MQITPISRTVGQDRVRVPPSSVPPKVLESVGRHVGVPDGVLNVLVAKVVLQGPRVVAIVGEFEPAGVAKHVRVDRKWHLGGLTDALDEAVEANRAERLWGNRGVACGALASRHRGSGARWESHSSPGERAGGPRR